jgi:uncharacterized protein (TIGR02996 family)
MRTFVYTDATSNKFWHIELSGKKFTVHFGRVGTNGQKQTKSFTSAAVAQREHDKLVAQKLKKGYVETTPAPAQAPPSTERAALESALAAHPGELAAHSAYADYLMEEGDPRGAFIQVQLALEDPARTKTERTTLLKREKALLKQHARAWMGDVGRFLVGTWSGEDKPYGYRFARGWLDYVRVLPFPTEVVAALAGAPEARLLRHLEIVYDMRYHPFDFDQFTNGPSAQLRAGEAGGHTWETPLLQDLTESPVLTNLRVLKYGFSDDRPEGPAYSTMIRPCGINTAQHVLALLKNCPRLEELYLNIDFANVKALLGSPLLGNLRVLQYYYGSVYHLYAHSGGQTDPYPLSALAKNKALANLTTLRLLPGRDAVVTLDELDALVRSKNLPALTHLQVRLTTLGDEGADRIARSGILKRLKTLDIGYGNMTDAGAEVLAACPDLKNLDVLDVSRNALTPAGIRDLSAAGVRVVAENQHDEYDQDYMYADYE